MSKFMTKFQERVVKTEILNFHPILFRFEHEKPKIKFSKRSLKFADIDLTETVHLVSSISTNFKLLFENLILDFSGSNSNPNLKQSLFQTVG